MQVQNITQPLTGSYLPPSPLWRKWQLCSLTSTSDQDLPARERQTDANHFAQALKKQTLDTFLVLHSDTQKCHKGSEQTHQAGVAAATSMADTAGTCSGDTHIWGVCWGLDSPVFTVTCPPHSRTAQ